MDNELQARLGSKRGEADDGGGVGDGGRLLIGGDDGGRLKAAVAEAAEMTAGLDNKINNLQANMNLIQRYACVH